MAKLKYYALCSRNMHTTKRHLDTIPKEDLVIVINTLLDTEERVAYKNEAVAWCQAEGVEYYVTESDGTPSTGKNSVFDIFQNSDNDYMVLVDGDDWITPHGIWLYDKIAQSESPPDVIALEYQIGVLAAAEWSMPESKTQATFNPAYIPAFAYRTFLHTKSWWEKTLEGTYIPYLPNDEYSRRLNAAHTRIYSFAYNYINNWEPHLRITFYSKKACTSEFRMDPELLVGEDTMQYCNLKFAWSRGRIDLRHLHETYPTYVYDQRLEGIVDYANKRDEDWGSVLWMDRLAEAYDEFLSQGKGCTTKPDYVDLPDFPEDYIADTSGLVNYPIRFIKYL